MTPTASLYYRRSPLVHLLRKVNHMAKRMLPGEIYRPLYESGISTYRSLQRAIYSRRARSGNDDERRRAETVLRVMPYSLVGSSGLEATYDAVVDLDRRGVEGSIVECGVAQGGCAGLMALVAKSSGNRRRMYLFDSYEGLPDPTKDDYVGGATGLHGRTLDRGACLGTVQQVEGLLFETLGLDREKITLIKGWFQDTLAPQAERISPIALLRIDADWYESVKCCLERLFDRVRPDGTIIIDDYGSCFGAKKAVDEFLASRGLRAELIPDGRGGVVFRKPA